MHARKVVAEACVAGLHAPPIQEVCADSVCVAWPALHPVALQVLAEHGKALGELSPYALPPDV
jgi:hypothetical protein